MSKNFEVLQRVDEEDLFVPVSLPAPEPKLPDAPVCPSGRAHEELANLVQRLFLHSAPHIGVRMVSFSSLANGKRSSWICAETARILALQTNKSVCVVDADLWSPQLHTHFDANNRQGLSDALTVSSSIKSFVEPLSTANLWLLPAGSRKAKLYGEIDNCRARFVELREHFHYILVSAPSVTRETEATLMGTLADGVVLIVEANQSRRHAVLQAKERLETAQVQLLGAVLDQRTFPIPEFLYRKL
jgi:Mrp family chromosome partitioning ATPase